MKLIYIVIVSFLFIGCSTNKSQKPTDVFQADNDAFFDTDLSDSDTDFSDNVNKYEQYKVGYSEPSVEHKGNFTILRLIGTPYEMGYQHGTLLHDKIIEAAKYIKNTAMYAAVVIAKSKGLIDVAKQASYPDVVAECQGLVDAVGEEIDMDMCLTLAYGDVIIEYISSGGFQCSQFTLTGKALKNNGFIHARVLDWSKIDAIIDNPTLIVKAPQGKIPYIVLGFPMNIVPYQGFNMAGISIASNEADTISDHHLGDRSYNQMMIKILENCENFDQAIEFIKSQQGSAAENIMITDGKSGKAAALELTANHIAVRKLKNGIVYMTNHFVDPSMLNLQKPPKEGSSTWNRFLRLSQLLEPDGKNSLYGELDLKTVLLSVMRDRYNPYTGETVPVEQFENKKTIANNGAMQAFIFDSENRTIYCASGQVPLLFNPFTGFTLDSLFMLPNAKKPEPAQLP